MQAYARQLGLGPDAFSIVADAAPVMMWLTGPDGHCTFCNRHWLNFTGRALEQELGVGWTASIHPDDRRACLAAVKAAFRHHAPFERELRMRRADGLYRWVLDIGLPRHDAEGKYAGHIGSCVDITRRRRVKTALHNVDDRFRTLAANAQDTVYRYRLWPTRSVEYVNAAIFEITGHTPEEFYADPDLFPKLVHSEYRHLLALNGTRDPRSLREAIVLRFQHADGRHRWAEFRRVPIVDDDGRLIAVEGIGRDISARIEGEDSFRRLAAALQDAREQERTAVARELHDELGQTLTSLKMDIVRAASDLGAAGGIGIDRLQSMIGAVELATETVRRLATSLRPPALDHLGLVAAIELEAAAVARRSRVRCRVVAKKPVAALRPEQSTALFRIVQEALTNVQRHANASAVTITITQRSKLLTIVIRDNGRGITAAELDDPASIGLLGMRERAAIAGATVEIGATARRGTAVSVMLPTP